MTSIAEAKSLWNSERIELCRKEMKNPKLIKSSFVVEYLNSEDTDLYV